MLACFIPRRTLFFAAILFIAACSQAYAEPIQIYLLGGQSNAAGSGLGEYVPPELADPFPDVQIYAAGEVNEALANRWIYLQQGLGYLPNVDSHGPELGFGHAMAGNLPDETIAIIKYAYGATNLAEDWRPPDANGQGAGPHYLAFINAVSAALAILDANNQEYEIAGMLWMQGESDTDNLAWINSYEENLTNFIKSIRTIYGDPNLPFIIGQIYPLSWTNSWVIRQAQFSVAASLYNVEMIVTRDFECCVHFMEDDYIMLGYRFADQALWLRDPPQLVGPAAGSSVGAEGAVLSCLPKAGALRYQLLLGPDPNRIDYVASDTAYPPDKTIAEFPFPVTWWTVRALDDSEPVNLSCDGQPRYLLAQNPIPPITNLNSLETYGYLQDAIDDANAGDVVVARPWVYPGSIDFKGRNITLRSVNPNDPAVIASTVINDRGLKPAISYTGTPHKGAVVNFSRNEDHNCIMAGFTIISENEIYSTAEIRCCNDAGPVITNCVLAENKSPDIYTVHTTYCTSGTWAWPVKKTEAVFITTNNNLVTLGNCLITGSDGGGAFLKQSLAFVMNNCTVVGNGRYGIHSESTSTTVANCIVRDNLGPSIDGSAGVAVTYSNIEGGFAGGGNIDVDPCFLAGGYWDNNGTPADFNDDVWNEGNYRLRGDSACIDAGSNGDVLPDFADLDGDANFAEPVPSDLDGRERFADGDCSGGATVDMGAYEFAWAYAGDFDGGCDVDFADYAVLGSAWLAVEGDANWDPACDIAVPADDSINILDLTVLVCNWLSGSG